jgi:hypothetical protein
VDFVPIGQARTYIDVTAAPDWRTDHDSLAKQLAAGQNLVSYGLAVDLRQAGPARSKSVPVELTVWGPSWAVADEVTIYSNGTPVFHRKLGANRKPGQKFAATLQIPLPQHDAALLAVTTGPGVREPFWEVRKSYQPTSDEWNPIVLGVSRALWIDADASGEREAPLHHARRLVDQHQAALEALVGALSSYDSSVAAHVLNLLHAGGKDLASLGVESIFLNGSATVREAYKQYLRETRKP